MSLPKLYADDRVRAGRQVSGDLALLVWIVICVRLGQSVHDATMRLAGPGRELRRSGDGLGARMRDAASAVDGAPLIGDRLRAPFDGAGSAADRLAAAGTAQVHAVTDLAGWLQLAVTLVPVLLACAFYLPSRIRFVRRAGAAQRLVDAGEDLDLFALRALARQPMHRLARISDDPAGAWRRGDVTVVHRLAELELRTAGLKPPKLTEVSPPA
jgi:hypothetical protein